MDKADHAVVLCAGHAKERALLIKVRQHVKDGQEMFVLREARSRYKRPYSAEVSFPPTLAKQHDHCQGLPKL